MIFGLRKTTRYRFYFDKAEIEIVNSFKYLGVTFSKTRSFCAARKHVLGQARKTLQLLYKKIKKISLPIDLQLKMFDHTVLPLLLYGSEIWGFENIDQLETFHNDFLRKISNLRNSTPIYTLHGKLGRFPISINIKMRMLGFWISMITGKAEKFSRILYKTLLDDEISGIKQYKWVSCIKNILQSTGKNDIWLSQKVDNIRSVKSQVQQTLKDQYRQEWAAQLEKSSKGINYRLIKNELCLKELHMKFKKSVYKPISQYRSGNHKLPVEIGRWEKILYNQRICPKCPERTLGDEYLYLLECEYYKHSREKYIKRYYYLHPNILKFNELMNNLNLKTARKRQHKSQNTKLESQKFETRNSKHPYIKHNVPMGEKLKEKVVNKKMTIVQVYLHRHFYRFLFKSPSRRLTAQDTKHKAKTQNLKVINLKLKTQNILTQNTMSLIGFRRNRFSIPYSL